MLLVLAFYGLHNYIREHTAAGEKELGLDTKLKVEEVVNSYYNTTSETFSATAINRKREELTEQMWNDYELYKTRQ